MPGRGRLLSRLPTHFVSIERQGNRLAPDGEGAMSWRFGTVTGFDESDSDG